MRKIGTLAAAGSTGNNTHASVDIAPDIDAIMAKVEITAVGATPTLTYKLQGTLDTPDVSDANSDWFDLFTLPHDSATEAASYTKTAVGVYPVAVDLKRRPVRKVRLVSSANTNVTYEADLFGLEDT